MAVQVIVKGPNDTDYTLFGYTLSMERIKDIEEVVILKDINGALLYIVPLTNVRYTTPIPNENIPVNPRENVAINLHIKGNTSGDLMQVCNLIKYARPYETTVAELFNSVSTEEGQVDQLLLSVPFSEIRYIDFNYPLEVEELTPEPTNQKKEEGRKPPKVGVRPTVRS